MQRTQHTSSSSLGTCVFSPETPQRTCYGGSVLRLTAWIVLLFATATASEGFGATPEISNLSPAPGAIFVNPTNGIQFEVTSDEPVEASAISLVLNGRDVSDQLAIGGGDTSRTVQFEGLTTNTVYTAEISVAGTSGSQQTHLYFDTFVPDRAFTFEVEDYNYGEGECGPSPTPSASGGQYQNDPPPSGLTEFGGAVGGLQPDGTREGYLDAVGAPEIDFHGSTSTSGDFEVNQYRFCDPVGTHPGGDFLRDKYREAELPDYAVFQIQPDEWWNYTRDLEENEYLVYLRAAATAAQQIRLDRVTGDPSQADQTTEPLGSFFVPNTGETNAYRYAPLLNEAGTTPQTVSWAGAQTVRLTAIEANNNLHANFVLLIPADLVVLPPTVVLTSPEPDATFPADADVPLSATAETGEGAIASVEFVAQSSTETIQIGEVTEPPYEFTWTAVPEGNYTLTARAADNQGATGVSSPVRITVGNPPDNGGPPPELDIAWVDDELLLSWPASAQGYTLQQSTDISDPESWSDVGTAPQTEADQQAVTLTPAEDRLFFRLIRP